MKARHVQILDIIMREDIETQEDLAARLQENGFNVTQATVSRDIKELRLIKVPNREGGYRYASPSDQADGEMTIRLYEVFTRSVKSVVAAENIVIVKTLSGMASAAATAIDAMNLPEIAGSIAGDDTIMVVTFDRNCAARIANKFNASR